MHNYKSNRELLAEFDKYVKGHTEAKKAIINLVNKSKIRYYQRYAHLDDQYHLIEPSKILLMGPSGTGKTFLVETAARLMNFPLIKLDATFLAPTSAGEGLSSNKLAKLIKMTAKHLVKTSLSYHSEQGVIDQTVIFVDEIDKLAKSRGSAGDWNRHIQDSFLTMFDNKDEFAGVSFIFAGAFTGIEKQTVATSIGFNQANTTQSQTDWDQSIVQYGITPELAGRIRGIYALATLTKEDYREILEDILLPAKQDELVYFNQMDFWLNEIEINTMVDKAFKSGQGIRSLKRELDKHVLDLEFYYEDVEETSLLENMIDRYGSKENI